MEKKNFKTVKKTVEKKIFKTVEQVADYLDDECYYLYLDKYYEDELKDIEVDGMEKFLPGKYHIQRRSDDDVVAIFTTKDRIEYIWRMTEVNDYEYIARVVDREEIANAIAEYSQYIKNGGYLDISSWLKAKSGDDILSVDYSVDYEVLTTIDRIR